MKDLKSGIEHLKQAKAHMSKANGSMSDHISKLKALEEENAELRDELDDWKTQPDDSYMNKESSLVLLLRRRNPGRSRRDGMRERFWSLRPVPRLRVFALCPIHRRVLEVVRWRVREHRGLFRMLHG